MARPHALLRAGFPYLTTLGMRRMTHFPVDIAIGDEGRLYVICRGEGVVEIRKFNWSDEDLGTIGGPGRGEGRLTWPAAILRDRDENLFVSDEALHRVSVFSRESGFLSMWGEHGTGDGQLNRPSGMAFDAEENIYVADTLNHRVQKLTRDGKFLLKWGGFGQGEGQFNMPWGIAVDELGDVYVADWRNDRIQKFTPEGGFLFKFGTSGSGNGQFNRPSGVAVGLGRRHIRCGLGQQPGTATRSYGPLSGQVHWRRDPGQGGQDLSSSESQVAPPARDDFTGAIEEIQRAHFRKAGPGGENVRYGLPVSQGPGL